MSKRRAPYQQINLRERRLILHFKKEGQSLRQIAKVLNRSASTISRELSRNNLKGTYNAELANDLAHARKCVMAGGERNALYLFADLLRRKYQHKKRHLVAWMSDTQDYFRINLRRPFKLLLNARRNFPIRFSIIEKPDHYRKLREMIGLLNIQDKINNTHRWEYMKHKAEKMPDSEVRKNILHPLQRVKKWKIFILQILNQKISTNSTNIVLTRNYQNAA